jgi:hypothetical protein
MRWSAGVLNVVAVGIGGYFLEHTGSGQSLVTSPGVAFASRGGGSAWLGADQPVDGTGGIA